FPVRRFRSMPSRRWSRTVLATLIWFFAFVASAHAESAWVLWSKSPESGGTWQPSGAHPSFDHCQQYLNSLLRNQPDQTEGQWVVTPGGALYTKNRVVHQELVCLPDTIDPRGPKGK